METAMHSTTRNGASTAAFSRRRNQNESHLQCSQGVLQQHSSGATAEPNTAVITSTPVTHLMAGAKLPVCAEVKAHQYRLENHVNLDFLNSIETIVEYLQFALENNLVTQQEIDSVLAIEPIGRHRQVSACVELIQSSFEDLVDTHKVDAAIESLPECPQLADVDGKKWYQVSDHWEHDFMLSLPMWDEMHDEIHEFAEHSLALVTKNYGLCVLEQNVVGLELDPAVKKCLIQLIYFCAYISGHATSIDLVTDEYMECIVTGTDYYLHEDEEAILDEDQMEFIDEYKVSSELCKSLSKGIVSEPSVAALTDLAHSMEAAGDLIPDWMHAVRSALMNGYTQGINFCDYAENHGGLPTPYLRPVGFGIPVEDFVHRQAHEMIAYGEEVSMLVKLDGGTKEFLTNIDLAEKLLQYIQAQTNNWTN